MKETPVERKNCVGMALKSKKLLFTLASKQQRYQWKFLPFPCPLGPHPLVGARDMFILFNV